MLDGRYRRFCVILVQLLLVVGCRPKQPAITLAPADGEFSVMTYNVRRYCFDDRDGDGQRDDPKPESEKQAVVNVIVSCNPDILALQEMGTRALLDELADRLAARGLHYDHRDMIQTDYGYVNLAVLSRIPISRSDHITNEVFTIGKREFSVFRGFLSTDFEPQPGYRFRLVTAHLKSKIYSPAGQTEMRRNEARLLNKRIRWMLDENPDANILVVGDMNDNYNSAAVREITGKPAILHDLRPRDELGDIWTHFWSHQETYERLDYMFVTEGLRHEVVTNKVHAVRMAEIYKASDHRPLVAVFRARDDRVDQNPND